MHLLYLHGLDSSPSAIKATITATHAHAQGIDCTCPDLNAPPEQVLTIIKNALRPDSVLIGSSLGGYFASLVSDMTGTPAVLLNPSIRPDVSFRRFLADSHGERSFHDTDVIYRTAGGWEIVYGDLAWFEAHRLRIHHPERIKVLLKLGDELLDAHATQGFYTDKGAHVHAHAGGDHRISDYDDHVADVVNWAVGLGGAR